MLGTLQHFDNKVIKLTQGSLIFAWPSLLHKPLVTGASPFGGTLHQSEYQIYKLTLGSLISAWRCLLSWQVLHHY